MAKKCDVLIYMRDISLDVVIPAKHAFAFMEQFGTEFAVNDSSEVEGDRRIKAVNGYHDHPAGWHIKVSVWENDENRFYNFLERFSQERGLSFRDPRRVK